jgi:catechol 2,3-dioxygenase-like lactoylglutathione lyase family enzyme
MRMIMPVLSVPPGTLGEPTEGGGPVLADCYSNVVLPAKDADRARAFCRDVLGLTLMSGPTDDPMMFQAGAGTGLLVTEMPDRGPAGYATVSFLVTDIEALVVELAARGVELVTPGSTSFQGTEGAVTGAVVDYGTVKSVWLRDSEGNLLALNELVSG